MTDIREIPNFERDETAAAFDELDRMMPRQAQTARLMMDQLLKQEFTEDQALQLIAYSLFH